MDLCVSAPLRFFLRCLAYLASLRFTLRLAATAVSSASSIISLKLVCRSCGSHGLVGADVVADGAHGKGLDPVLGGQGIEPGRLHLDPEDLVLGHEVEDLGLRRVEEIGREDVADVVGEIAGLGDADGVHGRG